MLLSRVWESWRPRQLWLRRSDTGETHPLGGTDFAQSVTWSPDSTRIAFDSRGRLQSVSVKGGPPTTITEVSLVGSLSWGERDYILGTDAQTNRLLLISARNGEKRLLGELVASRQETAHVRPQFLPGGSRYIYFARSSNSAQGAVYGDSIDAPGGEASRVKILDSRAAAVYAPARREGFFQTPKGYLLTVRDDTLMAFPFDPGNLRLEEDPAAVTTNAYWGLDNGGVGVSASTNGIIAVAPPVRNLTELVLYSRDGKLLDTPFPEGTYYSPSFSRDGGRVAVSRMDTNSKSQNVWVIDLQRQTSSRVTSGVVWEGFPLWSPDDRQLVFAARSGPSDQRAFYQQDALGVQKPSQILAPVVFPSPYDWSRQGGLLIYSVIVGQDSGHFDLWVLPLGGAGQPYPWLQSADSALYAQFSPDGRWVVFSWTLSGRSEIYLRPFDLKDTRRWQVSSAGGTQPRWSADGKEIFFLSTDGNLMSVPVAIASSEVKTGAPRALFRHPPLPPIATSYEYDVSPRGDRFVFTQTRARSGVPPVRLILNWEALLKP